MNRREFLGAGATAGVVGALAVEAPGCAPGLLPSRPSPAGVEAEAAEFVGQTDHFDAWLSRTEFPLASGILGPREQLARQGVRTLHVTGLFGALSEDAALHPAVQRRMVALAPEMASTVREMNALLVSRPAEELEAIGQALRDDPDFPMLIGEYLERDASAAGVGLGNRTRLRGLMSQATWRLRHQPPARVVEEYAEKMSRVRAIYEDPVRGHRALTARLTGRMLFEYEALMAGTSTIATPYVAADEGLGDDADPEAPPDVAEKPGRPVSSLVWAGLACLGIGIAIGVAGYLLIPSTGLLGAFIITPGALGVILGLVLLIVGGVKSAR